MLKEKNIYFSVSYLETYLQTRLFANKKSSNLVSKSYGIYLEELGIGLRILNKKKFLNCKIHYFF